MSVLPSPGTPYYGGGQVTNPANVIHTSGPPSSVLTEARVGTLAVDNGNNNIYGLSSKASGVNTWVLLGGSSATFTGLEGDNLGTATPDAGVVIVAGTANQITTSGASHTLTLSLPSAITAPGSLTVTSGFTVSAGAVTMTTGTSAINISADAAATTINIGTGAGAKTIVLGSINTTSGTTVQGGSGGIVVASTNATMDITSGTGALNISNDAAATTVRLGTGAGAKTVTVGSTNTTSTTNLAAGSGGVNCSTDFNLTTVATKISMNGGAVTDFIGTATLTNGTVTVANTNIATADRILVTRSAVNASTALGVFKVVKTDATNFVITACKPADATTETGDASTVDYIIMRQT